MSTEINESKAPVKSSQKLAIGMQIMSGPIPSPDVLEHYQKIDPSLPGRIMAMAETQSLHRHTKEIQELDQEENNSSRNHREVMTGHTSGFLLAALFLGAGVYLVVSGVHITGYMVAAIGPIAALVSKFIVKK